MIKDFITLAPFSGGQLLSLLRQAADDKRKIAAGDLPPTLARKTLAMIFEKPSLRTRVSFETAMTQLGGHAMCLSQSDIGLGTREPARDVARVLSRMCHGIMARTFSHDTIVQLAAHADVPVINALSDYSHPCQAMADLMTVAEAFGELRGRKLVFVGDGNNVARSLAIGCVKLGMDFVLACPAGYELDESGLKNIEGDGSWRILHDAPAAADGAHVLYTDTWISMGQEAERQKRLKDFAGFQVNAELLAVAAPDAVVMHCLPAYRGYEITDETFEAHAGTIFSQAENRLHFQRTLLNVLLATGGIA